MSPKLSVLMAMLGSFSDNRCEQKDEYMSKKTKKIRVQKDDEYMRFVDIEYCVVVLGCIVKFYWKTCISEVLVLDSFSFGHCLKKWTLPHGKGDYSAPQIARETNDGDSESWEQGLQDDASDIAAEYDRYVY